MGFKEHRISSSMTSEDKSNLTSLEDYHIYCLESFEELLVDLK